MSYEAIHNETDHTVVVHVLCMRCCCCLHMFHTYLHCALLSSCNECCSKMHQLSGLSMIDYEQHAERKHVKAEGATQLPRTVMHTRCSIGSGPCFQRKKQRALVLLSGQSPPTPSTPQRFWCVMLVCPSSRGRRAVRGMPLAYCNTSIRCLTIHALLVLNLQMRAIQCKNYEQHRS